MPASVKAILKKEAKADGTHLVLVQIIKDRKVRRYSSGISVPKSHWNPKATNDKWNWINSKSRFQELYNGTIRNLVDEAQGAALLDRSLSADQLQAIGKGTAPVEAEGDFLEFFEKELARMRNTVTPRTYMGRRAILHKLQKFRPSGLPYSQLTVGLVRDYITHLQIKHKNGEQSIAREIRIIHAVLKLAIMEKRFKAENDPFSHIKLSDKKAKKERLTEDEITKLHGLQGNLTTPAHINALLIFLMQFYLQGARVGDMIELRWENNVKPERIDYVMRKTGKHKSIKRNRFIDAILDYYRSQEQEHGFIFPYLKEHEQLHLIHAPTPHEQLEAYLIKVNQQTKNVNRNLKALAKLAEIEINLTSHIARHTFASIARMKLKGNIAAIQDMMEHSSSQTTERYLDAFGQDANDAAALEVYGD